VFKKKQRSSTSDNAIIRKAGLSSERNRQIVVEILQDSTQEDIAKILVAVGYCPPPDTFRIPPAQREAEIKRRADAYLATVDGQRDLSCLKEERLEKEAEKWLRTNDAQDKLEKLRARVFGSHSADDPDLFERACRDEIAKQVAEWLASPLGQEAVDQARTRTLQAQAADLSRRRDRISKIVGESKCDGGGK
jgi:hypothetical protein